MRAHAEAEPSPIPDVRVVLGHVLISDHLLAETRARQEWLRNPPDDWEPDWDALEDDDR